MRCHAAIRICYCITVIKRGLRKPRLPDSFPSQSDCHFWEGVSVGKSGALLVARREQNKQGSVSRLALTTAHVFAGLPAFSTASWTACDPIAGTQFVCSGVNTTPQTIDSPGAQVTTMPGFSVDAATGGGEDALQISICRPAPCSASPMAASSDQASPTRPSAPTSTSSSEGAQWASNAQANSPPHPRGGRSVRMF